MAEISEILWQIFALPLTDFISSAISLLPRLALAVLLLVLMYFISYLVGISVKKVLYKIRIDRLVRVKGMRDTFGATSLAIIFASLAKWLAFILFSDKVLEVIELGFISPAAQLLFSWATKLVFATAIIAIGMVIIDFFTLRQATKDSFFDGAIKILRFFLIIVVAFTALEQLGIRFHIAENIFLLIVGSVLLAVSVAVGIGFGLALKDEARQIIKSIRGRYGRAGSSGKRPVS